MSLLSQFARSTSSGFSPRVVVGRDSDVVPPPPPLLRPSTALPDGVDAQLAATARQLGNTLLATRTSELDLAHLEADVDEQVDVWTPARRFRSRFELVCALTDVDDTIGQIEIDFTETLATRSVAMLEWRATGRFTGPAFMNDDVLVEPTGAVIRVGGALSLLFSDSHRVTRVCCYYDRLTLIQQILYGSA